MAPRNIARVDESQEGCVAVARGIGAYVYLTHQLGRGFPDCIVAYRGNLFLVEFKSEKGVLSEDEESFHKKMAEQGITVHVIRTPGEMLRLLAHEEREEL